jgi:hypothetical protein
LPCLVADVRALPACSTTFDAVIAYDNALPHLLSEDEIHESKRHIQLRPVIVSSR